MTREQAEKRIGELAIEISEIVEDYYPKDEYLTLNMNLREGVIHFNNADWEHAVGKLNKTLFRKGGDWS